MRSLHRLYACLLLALAWPLQPVRAWTAAEIAAMPPYCAGRYARNTNPEEYKRWEAQYGPDFLHVHHLCDAIGALKKYYKAKTEMQKRGSLGEAMGHLDYMIQHASPDFKLMPEVYWYRSQTYSLMGRIGQALADIDRAIALDPKQGRFYVQAVQYLDKIGQKEQALKRVSEGLRHLPGNKALQELYTGLGGKPPYPEPYAQQAGEPAQQAAGKDEAAVKVQKRAVFDLSRNVGAGRKETPIVQGGAYVFVEVREDTKDPAKVHFRLYSQIPQPAARIASFGIDPGRYADLFLRLEVNDPLLGKYYPLRQGKGGHTHAYWPGFDPLYHAGFTIDPKEGKMYDPRSLPPGSGITLTATLAEGRSFEDVVQAMKRGLSDPSGLRFGIIAHHLMGYRPDPSKTIMDDAGFLTGQLRLEQGTQAAEQAKAKAEEKLAKGDEAAQADKPAAAAEPTPRPAATHVPIGTPKNPWCRFCPEQAAPSPAQGQ
jgi:tetratricopeptide (TPR) repeat protein